MTQNGTFRRTRGPSRALRLAAACCSVLLFSAGGVPHATAAAPANAGNPGGIHSVQNAIPGQYIVTLQNIDATQVPSVAARLARAHGGTLFQIYSHALTGFAVRMAAANAMALSHDPQVASVEEDGEAHVDTTLTQSGASWGLTRIDERELNLNGMYSWDDHADGAGVTVYILDTGIRITNVDFGGRAKWGVNTVDQTTTDGNGHGTHVAGIVGGTTYGVAKQVHLVAVKVLNDYGSGPWSGVIAGIDWVVAYKHGPAVINMSLGGGKVIAVNDAVENAIKARVTVVVAAGNNNANACNYSPASAPNAVTVAASDNLDRKATFSNWGECVDLFAPGVGITSDWIGSNTAINTISGTSMASPFVAGLAAMELELNPSATAGEVATEITREATRDRVTNLPISPMGTPNLLEYTGNVLNTPPF
jgi:aqualysin 1